MKLIKYLLIFICFIPLLFFRDFTPNNELKYLSIANEALRDGHFFTMWDQGKMYAEKPPLYFWILMLGKWLTGGHSMFYTALFSLVPALVILYIMNKWVEKDLPQRLRTSSSLMLITSGLFVGSAIVLRMDMLMCMFIVLALYTFYRLYTGEDQKYGYIKLPVYIFLGTFTKGPVGLLVPFLSIVCFLAYKRTIRSFGKYFGWRQWAILLGLFALWFTGVYIEGGPDYLNNLLFHQTVNRAIDAFHHKQPFWYYLKTIWYSLAPWIIFYLAVIITGAGKHLFNNDLKKFFLTVITTTFVALSVSSAKLDIYLLPVFPFVAYLAFLLLAEAGEKHFRWAIALPAIVLCMAFPGIFVAEKYLPFPLLHIRAMPVAAFVLSAGGVVCLWYLWKKELLRGANSLAVGLLLTIFIGSFALPSLNQYIGFREMSRKAQSLAKTNGIETYYFFNFRSGEYMDVYLHQEVQRLSLEEIRHLAEQQAFILFSRNKDLKRNKELQDIVRNRESYVVGDYNVIVF